MPAPMINEPVISYISEQVEVHLKSLKSIERSNVQYKFTALVIYQTGRFSPCESHKIHPSFSLLLFKFSSYKLQTLRVSKHINFHL